MRKGGGEGGTVAVDKVSYRLVGPHIFLGTFYVLIHSLDPRHHQHECQSGGGPRPSKRRDCAPPREARLQPDNISRSTTRMWGLQSFHPNPKPPSPETLSMRQNRSFYRESCRLGPGGGRERIQPCSGLDFRSPHRIGFGLLRGARTGNNGCHVQRSEGGGV
jgi:hypothetical protein